jgi:hypothetical protein
MLDATLAVPMNLSYQPRSLRLTFCLARNSASLASAQSAASLSLPLPVPRHRPSGPPEPGAHPFGVGAGQTAGHQQGRSRPSWRYSDGQVSNQGPICPDVSTRRLQLRTIHATARFIVRRQTKRALLVQGPTQQHRGSCRRRAKPAHCPPRRATATGIVQECGSALWCMAPPVLAIWHRAAVLAATEPPSASSAV